MTDDRSPTDQIADRIAEQLTDQLTDAVRRGADPDAQSRAWFADLAARRGRHAQADTILARFLDGAPGADDTPAA